jgi:lysyl-tRNA synthetase class 2
MTAVDSSALSHLYYDPHSETLRAIFRDSGRIYVYRNVPQATYDELLAAPSLGAFFNSHIRDAFPFEERPAVQ